MPTTQIIEKLPTGALQLLAKHLLLKPLIRKQLQIDTLSAIYVTDEAEQKVMGDFCRRNRIGNQQMLDSYLTKEKQNMEDLKWQVALPIRIAEYSKANFAHKSEQRFLERKGDLDKVIYSLIRTKNKNLARELYFRIAEGEATFADMAILHSEGEEKFKGGSVGPVSTLKAHPLIAEVLRTNPVGTLLKPFQVNEWWVILRVDMHLPACFDENTNQLMCCELFEEWLSQEVDQLFTDLNIALSA